jgi:hypothetical protein
MRIGHGNGMGRRKGRDIKWEGYANRKSMEGKRFYEGRGEDIGLEREGNGI